METISSAPCYPLFHTQNHIKHFFVTDSTRDACISHSKYSVSRQSHIDPTHRCITIPGPKRNERNKTRKILSDDSRTNTATDSHPRGFSMSLMERKLPIWQGWEPRTKCNYIKLNQLTIFLIFLKLKIRKRVLTDSNLYSQVIRKVRLTCRTATPVNRALWWHVFQNFTCQSINMTSCDNGRVMGNSPR
jgi:hypothetical protein